MKNTLYNICQKEKKNYKDLNIQYNKKYNSMQYANSEGVLTVLYGKEDNEEFYYRKSVSIQGEKEGLGNLIMTLSEKGTVRIESPELNNTPMKFKEVVKNYYINRKQIGIDDKPKGYER